MIGQKVPRRRRFKILDPGFKGMRLSLEQAIDNETFMGGAKSSNIIAAGPGYLAEAIRLAERKNAQPVLLLDGPTPINAKRVPASLLVLPLPLPLPQNEVLVSYTVELHVKSALNKVLAKSSSMGAVPFDLARWRALGLSCEQAGEKENRGSGARVFGTLLAGGPSKKQLQGDWFWLLATQVCEEAGCEIDVLLERLLVDFTIWFSPYTGEPIGLKDAVLIYETVQRHWQSNQSPSHCYGAQYWNHPSISATFSGQGGQVTFHETQDETISAALQSNGKILSWAGRTDLTFEKDCREKNIPLFRIEDGFLRSVGLGAGLARGAMLAVDDLGIYYDPSRPSRLEALLNEYDLSDHEQDRATALTDLIRTARVSKYNFGKSRHYDFPENKQKLLVPGQVADDAAIRKSKSATIACATTPNVNLDLLKLARKRNPDAYLIFKPHPDVETGLRKGKLSREDALNYADEIAEEADIIDLLDAVDIVETFSSLSGFEALLRDKKVVVHGAPFYAGWGLSEDLTEIEGRQRNRTLPELVYLALVQYARTIDPVTLLPCTPEFLVTRLTSQRKDRRHLITTTVKRHASWLGRKLGI
ncbi:MAG: hypothetical protein K5905_07340 [Roseibium sp.]|uniref:capsular polysaccharide export protein, LipB/KpsS family n=1 Tax=Roseibium sp. TaxID=1936156 RepID=UPI002620E14A|nr:hypothetical protein [Roseibium sp.]MCV0425269.1 hypothetical protein [Roseibium sp.]